MDEFTETLLLYRYPEATSILLTCDGGGSNSANKYIFKYDLGRLSESIGLEIRIAHYPHYPSPLRDQA